MQPSQTDMFSQAIAVLDEQGKTSFCIWIAVQVQNALETGEARRIGIDRAVELLRTWESGKPVTGDELNALLMDANDEGLYAFVDSRNPSETATAIEAIAGTICYVAWLAYRKAGQRLPNGIDRVNDDFIIWTIEQALDARAVTPESCLSSLRGLARARPGEPTICP
jgi:hypothetical protein